MAIVGTIDFRNGGTQYLIVKKVLYDNYLDDKYYLDDIALLKTDETITFNSKVKQ